MHAWFLTFLSALSRFLLIFQFISWFRAYFLFQIFHIYELRFLRVDLVVVPVCTSDCADKVLTEGLHVAIWQLVLAALPVTYNMGNKTWRPYTRDFTTDKRDETRLCQRRTDHLYLCRLTRFPQLSMKSSYAQFGSFLR